MTAGWLRFLHRRRFACHLHGPAVGLERIISTARADNAASRRVMEKCGLAFQEEFTHKGVLVAWHAIDRADWQAWE